MKEKNIAKINRIRNALKSRNLLFEELPNGQFKVDTVNLWATTERWHDTNTGEKGQGANSFFKYLRKVDII